VIALSDSRTIGINLAHELSQAVKELLAPEDMSNLRIGRDQRAQSIKNSVTLINSEKCHYTPHTLFWVFSFVSNDLCQSRNATNVFRAKEVKTIICNKFDPSDIFPIADRDTAETI